jgi:S1-C subfamily serine protease
VLGVQGDFSPSTKGFLITAVIPEGPAAKARLKADPKSGRVLGGNEGLKEGDVILAIAGQEFEDYRDYLDRLNEAAKLTKSVVEVKVQRPGSKKVEVVIIEVEFQVIDIPARTLPDIDRGLAEKVKAAPDVPVVPRTIRP